MNSNLLILKYTILIYSIIFSIGIILTLSFRKTNWGRNMFVATTSWLMLSVIFVFTSYFSEQVFTLLILLITFLAVREYYILNKIWNLPSIIVASLFLITMAYSIISGNLKLFYAVPGISALFFFLIQLLKPSPKQTNRDACIGTSGLVYWGWLMFHFTLLHRLEQGFGYVIFLCSLIALNDNSAYFIGKLLGHNSKKMAPMISPSKTWVGTIGGAIVTVCVAFLFHYTVSHLTFIQIGVLAIIVAIAIPLGDLIESVIKRDIGIKDSGNLIPGHGGAMDRFDSWTFTVPIMYYYILFIL